MELSHSLPSINVAHRNASRSGIGALRFGLGSAPNPFEASLNQFRADMFQNTPEQAANAITSVMAYDDINEFLLDLPILCQSTNAQSYGHLLEVALALEDQGYLELSRAMLKTLEKPQPEKAGSGQTSANQAELPAQLARRMVEETGKLDVSHNQVQRLIVRFYKAQPDETAQRRFLDELVRHWSNPAMANDMMTGLAISHLAQITDKLEANPDPVAQTIAPELRAALPYLGPSIK